MAKVMTSKEIEAEYGIPAEQIERWADDAEKGVFHGEPRGKVVKGRPLPLSPARTKRPSANSPR